MRSAGDAERWMVGLLTGPERDALRRMAIPRAVTRELVPVLAGAGELEPGQLPLVQPAPWDPDGNTFILDAGVRSALIEQWSEDRGGLAELHERLAAQLDQRAETRVEALYHRLCIEAQRRQALESLRAMVEEALGGDEPNIGTAHDLLHLLEDPILVSELVEVEPLQRDLRAKLARRSAWIQERDLTHTYFARGCEDAVWRRFLADDERWILQIHAPGGLGKTMFVRSLLARRCPKEEIAAARIDFDYVAHLVLSSNQPWRLLLAIARQLSPQLPTDPFERLLASWGHLEASTTSRRGAKPPPEDLESQRSSDEVPRFFRAVLAEQPARVLVVLDTLENLLHTEGAALRDILDELARVHREVPSMRLVLAGRFDLGSVVRWGASAAEQAERVARFNADFVGDDEAVEEIAGAELRVGRQVLTLALEPFDSGQAESYLRERRGIVDPAYQTAIVSKAEGNPLKLAMLADAVLGASPPSPHEIAVLESTELYYLVNRIVDRIADPRVQWLLRWGAVPRVLSRDFALHVIWPRLVEQLERSRSWDRPEADALATMGRGVARYELREATLDFDQAWQAITAYAATSSWVSPIAELPDTLSFHPEVRDPIRGLLRKHHQDIYHELHRHASAYWGALAESSSGAAREMALRSVMFHALEPFRDRAEPPELVWKELLDQLGEDDRDARAAIAREVLDVQRRAERRDREDLVPPPEALAAAAHSEIALALLDDIARGDRRLPELRAHLARSSLSPGMRAATEARALRSVDEIEGAKQKLREALSGSLDEPTRAWVAGTLAAVTGDVEMLERTLQAAPEQVWREHAPELARALAAAERFDEACAVFVELGDPIGEAECLLELGEYDRAEARLPNVQPVEGLESANVTSLDDVEAAVSSLRVGSTRCMIALARYDAEWVVSSGWGNELVRSHARAMLGMHDQAFTALESTITAKTAPTPAEVVLSAMIFREAGELAGAVRALGALPSQLEPSLAATAALLQVEVRALLGDVEAAVPALASIAVEGLLRSVRMEAAITASQLHGATSEHLDQLLRVAREARSSAERLKLLRGLRRVGTPERPPEGQLQELAALCELRGDEVASLRLAYVEIMRVFHRPEEAWRALEPLLAPQRGNIAFRHARLAADRLGWPAAMEAQPPAPDWYPDSFRRVVDQEQARRERREWPGMFGVGPLRGASNTAKSAGSAAEDTSAATRFVPLGAPGLQIAHESAISLEGPLWSQSSGPSEPFPKEAPFLLGECWREECDRLGGQLAPHVGARVELLIELGRPDQAWIPWQLATVRGDGMRRATQTLRIRRCSGRTVEKGGVFSGAAVVIAKDDARFAKLAWQATAAWKLGPGLPARAEADRLVSSLTGTSIVHVLALLDELRGGAVAADLGSRRPRREPTGVHELARALAADGRPRLLLLDVPWPGSNIEAARQLLLRERFAWELFAAVPNLHVLCVGFEGVGFKSGGLRLNGIVGMLRSGQSIGEIASWLQKMHFPMNQNPIDDGIKRSFEDLACRGGTTLYSDDPDVRLAPS